MFIKCGLPPVLAYCLGDCEIFANLCLKLYYTGRQSVLASLHLHRSPYPHNQRQETTPTAFPIAFNNTGYPQDIK